MTPFDPVACLVMLLAFYPVPSPAALVQARSERPEYFSGATLIGHSGDKFQLPDGRIFDCIFAVDGPVAGRKWQMLDVTDGGAASPWPLEPGPLTPIDPDGYAPPRDPRTFERLVGGALDELGASDQVLTAAAQTVTDGAAASQLFTGSGDELEEVDRVVEEVTHSRGADVLAEILASSDALDGSVDTLESDYDEAPPQPRLPNEPDVPSYPGEDGTSGEPGRENPRHPEHQHEPAPDDGG